MNVEEIRKWNPNSDEFMGMGECDHCGEIMELYDCEGDTSCSECFAQYVEMCE